MSDIKCPLCKSDTAEKLFAVNGYDMLVCDSCELLYILPYPATEEERFEAVANNSHLDITVIGPEKYHEARKVYYQELWPLVEPGLAGAGSLLDIGCGTGHLLNMARQYGIENCQGLELNKARAAFARDNSGCEITESPVELFSSDEEFDVITMVDVLSHIYDYDKLFAAVKGLLNEGGRFVVKTGQYTREVKKNSVFDWEVPDHLHFMGMKTPEVIAEQYGMKIVSKESVSYADELYTRKRFLTKGRSWKRNVVKALLAYTPFAIGYLKKKYVEQYGDNCYSVVMVLEKR